MQIAKEHLLTSSYVWNNDGDINTLSDGPTRRRFDRFNGNSILHIINLFDHFVDELTVAQAQSIERLIQKELPLEVKSETSVLLWLKERRLQIFSLQTV